MMSYSRIWMPRSSASARARSSGTTLKPTIIVSSGEARASQTSFSLMPPMAASRMRMRTSSWCSFSSSFLMASVEPTVLDEQGRHDALALVEHGFEHRAARRFVGIGLEFLQFGDEGDGLQQFIDALAVGGAGLHERSIAAHVVGQDA